MSQVRQSETGNEVKARQVIHSDLFLMPFRRTKQPVEILYGD
jgi:hypothetical protein